MEEFFDVRSSVNYLRILLLFHNDLQTYYHTALCFQILWIGHLVGKFIFTVIMKKLVYFRFRIFLAVFLDLFLSPFTLLQIVRIPQRNRLVGKDLRA